LLSKSLYSRNKWYKIPFLHINHLLDNKKAVDRPKDRLDVFYLEKIKELREES
jgi:hypothetical protein